MNTPSRDNPTRQVVVIGAGPAGYVCAIRLAQLGQSVTVVERGELGGTCLNVGCIPSKALIAAGSLLERVSKAGVMGITAQGLELDVEKLVAWKAGIVERLTRGIGSLFKSHGIKQLTGTARFVDPQTLEVAGAGGVEQLSADVFVVATGSTPIEIPGFAFDGQHVWSSTEALAPDRVPDHLVVIGGGYIGLELGILYRKLGAEVTVLEATAGALPGQDKDCVKVIERSLKKRKVRLMKESTAQEYSVTGDGLCVKVRTPQGEQDLNCDQIVSTVGRRPFTAGLGLEQAGLMPDERGFIPTDDTMRTAVSHIYAIGDCAGQPMLAHKGSKEGLVAAGAIAGMAERYDVACVPAVIFTAPEMAAVGRTEEECRAAGLEVRVGQFPFAASGRAMTLMDTEGFVKVVADAETDRILGVQMVGPEVTELIAEAALAMELGATAEDVARTIHAHPTLPEAFMEAAEAVNGQALHIYQARS
ncbi:MAG TPA: dihydrolipoyl dehydrogenase [Planctomycetota bacterium]|nr:dihydrolipoyl dehydrogenase [Planctomycetota bacterium]